MNKQKGENSKSGKFTTWPNMAESFPTISQEKRRRLTNAKPTKEYQVDINAYRFELESDAALAETAEIT